MKSRIGSAVIGVSVVACAVAFAGPPAASWADDDVAATTTCRPDVGTVSEDRFYDNLVLYDADFEGWGPLNTWSFVHQREDYSQFVSASLRQIEDDVSDGRLAADDVTNVVAFLETKLPAHVDAFWAKIDRIEAQLQTDGGMTAVSATAFLDAEYEWKMALYNDFVEAYNTDKLYLHEPFSTTATNLPANLGDELDNVISDFQYHLLGRSLGGLVLDGSGELRDPSSLTDVYDSTFSQLLGSGLDEAEAREVTMVALREAVERWVERADLDYLTGFQIQAEQYLEMATAVGYVRDLDAGEVVLDRGQPNTGALRLEDIFRDTDVMADSLYGSFGLDERLLMLDAEGGFISPQAMYDSDMIQLMVEDVMSPFDQLAGQTEKWAVLNAVKEALLKQYEHLEELAPLNEPVPFVLPYFMHILANNSLIRNAFRLQDGEEPLPLSRVPGWKDRSVVPGELPFDTYRTNIYSTAPTLQTTEVSREIVYVFEDGTQAAEPVTQAVSYRCIDGKRYFVDGVDAFGAVAHPEVTYDGAKVLEPTVAVGSESVTGTTDDSTITVTYPLEFAVTVNLVDTNGVAVASPLALTGRWGTPIDQAAPAVSGHTVRGPGSIQGTFGADRGPFTFVYERVADPEPSVAPTITNPADQAVPTGGAATFTVGATGVPSPGVTWQVSKDGAVTWQAITSDPAATPSADGRVLTVIGGPANHGNLYRATATNPGGSATSAAAVLRVNTPSPQPTDDPHQNGNTPSPQPTDDPDQNEGLPVTGSGSVTFGLLGVAMLLLVGGGLLLRVRLLGRKADNGEA